MGILNNIARLITASTDSKNYNRVLRSLNIIANEAREYKAVSPLHRLYGKSLINKLNGVLDSKEDLFIEEMEKQCNGMDTLLVIGYAIDGHEDLLTGQCETYDTLCNHLEVHEKNIIGNVNKFNNINIHLGEHFEIVAYDRDRFKVVVKTNNSKAASKFIMDILMVAGEYTIQCNAFEHYISEHQDEFIALGLT